MSAGNQNYIRIDVNQPGVRKLTAYGFTTTLVSDCSVGDTVDAELQLDSDLIDVQFRIRQQRGGESVCTFFDLGLVEREVIERYVRSKAHLTVTDDALEGRSYDDLAKGLAASDASESQSTRTPVKAPRNSALIKSAATLAMLLSLVAMVILAFLFMRSRSSLGVDNSALVGNYLPVHARIEGEVVEVLVKEGDFVSRGDVLLRLDNPEVRAERSLSDSEVRLCEAKVTALRKKLKNYLVNVEVAKKRLAIDLKVAQSDTESTKNQYKSAKAIVERTRPHVGTAISAVEFDVLVNEMLAMKAKYDASSSRIQLAQFAHDMSDSSVLMLGDRLDDEVGRITAELEIYEAELALSRRTLAVAIEREKQLDVVAPRDGQVYAAYRQFGEYLRAADEAIAISYPGETWAAGMVSVGQASRLRPGLPVRVSIPSLGKKVKGVVTAVGHRAMYGKGGYSADFRGTTATDVPVKVLIADLPEGVPSGMRLDMEISTGFGLEWLDNLTGFSLQPISGSESHGERNLDARQQPNGEAPKVTAKMTSFSVGERSGRLQ